MRTVGLVISLVALVACGGDDGDSGGDEADAAAQFDSAPGAADAAVLIDAGPAAFSFGGSVVGPSVPGNAKVIVVWVVSVGNDYTFKYGEGASAGALYNVGLADARPPAGAVNDYRPQIDAEVGVGLLVLVPSDLQLADGAEVDENDILGIAGQHAVIYREGTIPGGLDFDWPNDFTEATYECGECVEALQGQTFDSFAPVDCGEVVIDTDLNAGVCNWT